MKPHDSIFIKIDITCKMRSFLSRYEKHLSSINRLTRLHIWQYFCIFDNEYSAIHQLFASTRHCLSTFSSHCLTQVQKYTQT